MQGLFGLTPEDIIQQQQDEMEKRAIRYGEMDPFQRASAGMFGAGSGLADFFAPRLGGVNPAVQRAQQMRDMQKGVDLTSPEGLMTAAKRFSDAGMTEQALELVKAARDLEFKQAQAKQFAANSAKAERANAISEAQSKAEEDWMDSRPSDSSDEKAIREWYMKMPPHLLAKGGLGLISKLSGVTQQKLPKDMEIGPDGKPRPIPGSLLDIRTKESNEKQRITAEKLKAKQDEAESARRESIDYFDSLISNIDYLMPRQSVNGKDIVFRHKGLNSAVGPVDSMIPLRILPRDARDARQRLEQLQSQTLQEGLANAKKRAGQSFGSMQVAEWDRFKSLIADISSATDDDILVERLQNLRDWLIKQKMNIEGAKPVLEDKTSSETSNSNVSQAAIDIVNEMYGG